jgi:hypothetical protein
MGWSVRDEEIVDLLREDLGFVGRWTRFEMGGTYGG